MHGKEVPCYLGHRYLDERNRIYELAHVILTILTTLLIMTPHHWKYNEEEILNELKEYITSTYNQHYSAGTDKIQTLDLIEACGDGEAFCRSNILKYASRYDKKGTAETLSRFSIMQSCYCTSMIKMHNVKITTNGTIALSKTTIEISKISLQSIRRLSSKRATSFAPSVMKKTSLPLQRWKKRFHKRLLSMT